VKECVIVSKQDNSLGFTGRRHKSILAFRTSIRCWCSCNRNLL